MPSGSIDRAELSRLRSEVLAANLELVERGLAPVPGGDAAQQPGPFALGSTAAVTGLLERAGFTEIHVEPLELPRRHPDFEELWETTLDLSRAFHDAVLSRPAPEIEEIKASLAQRFAPYTAADGTLDVPGRTLVAVASA